MYIYIYSLIFQDFGDKPECGFIHPSRYLDTIPCVYICCIDSSLDS